MWRFSRKKQETVAIIFDEHRVTLSWITHESKTKHPHLNAHKTIALSPCEMLSGIIYNPTKLKKIITDFLTRYNLAHADISFIIPTDIVPEEYYKVSTDTLNENLTSLFNDKFWDYRYLCPSIDQDGFVVYACGLKREHLFQYQLFALFCNVKLRTITNHTTTLLTLYKQLHGAAFRQTQLSTDLNNHDYNLNSYFTSDSIARSMRVHPEIDICWEQDYKNLACALGLFFSTNGLS